RGPRPQAGLIDYLTLAPAEQRARYLANLQKNAAANPDDPRWKIRLGRELLAEGKIEEGLDAFHGLKASPGAAVLVEAGRILLEFERYDAAREFLEPALAADQSLNTARLDLATVRFHLQTPEAALAELDKMPPTGRQGDFYLLRAQI